MEVNGGLVYASDGGGDFLLMEASQVWDVTTYKNPKRDTLEKNNLISYVVNPDGTLRAAFISGTRNWSPPSYDDNDDGHSGVCETCGQPLSSFSEEYGCDYPANHSGYIPE